MLDELDDGSFRREVGWPTLPSLSAFHPHPIPPALALEDCEAVCARIVHTFPTKLRLFVHKGCKNLPSPGSGLVGC